jgi:hypothetical protein
MTTLATETWTGTTGAAWPTQWTVSNPNGTATIQGNAGQLTFPTGASYQSGALATLSGMTATRDTDVTVTVTFSQVTDEAYFWIGLRKSGTFGTNDYGYYLSLYPGTGGAQILKHVSGTETVISSALGLGSWVAGTARKVRFQAVGNTVQVKAWPVGSQEPATWNFSTTDTSLSANTGAVFLGTFGGAAANASIGSITVDDLSVTDGAARTWVRSSLAQAAPNGGTSNTYSFLPADAGNLLVAVGYGSVTFTTPTGWTLQSTQVTNGGLYVWSKTATGGESSFASTHNGSNYPTAVVVYEFLAGSTFTAALNGTTGSAATAASQSSTLPALTLAANSNNTVFGVMGMDAGQLAGMTGSTTWTGPAGLAGDVDLLMPGSTTDGYYLATGALQGTATTSCTPTATTTNNKSYFVIREAITFAVTVAPPGAGTTLAGVVASASATAPAGTLAVTGNATVAGAVGAATAAAPAGTVVVGATLAGPVATATATAPAGALASGAVVAGATATATATAPVGAVSALVPAPPPTLHVLATVIDASGTALLASDGTGTATIAT